MSIQVIDHPEVKAMTSSAAGVPVSEVSATLARLFGAVYGHVVGNGGAPAGQPFARYNMVGDHVFDIEAGIPVSDHVDGTDEIAQATLPAGPTAKYVHTGPYEELGAAHEAVHAWIEENGAECTGAPWEIYVTDPGQEPDNSKWVTEVYYPLSG